MGIKKFAISTVFLAAGTIGCVAQQTEPAPCVLLDTGTLTVDVTHIREGKGQLMMALHNHKRAFDRNDDRAAFASVVLKLGGKTASFSFHDLPAGNYAVVLFHDENANGIFDIKGDIPLEGYGISGARHALDQPSFRKASVAVGQKAQTISVKMHYYK